MIEACKQADKYRIAGTKRLGQAWLRADELGINLHPFCQRFERRKGRKRARAARRDRPQFIGRDVKRRDFAYWLPFEEPA